MSFRRLQRTIKRAQTRHDTKVVDAAAKKIRAEIERRNANGEDLCIHPWDLRSYADRQGAEADTRLPETCETCGKPQHRVNLFVEQDQMVVQWEQESLATNESSELASAAHN